MLRCLLYNIQLSLINYGIDPNQIVIWQALSPYQNRRRASVMVEVTEDSVDGYSLRSMASNH